MAQRWVLALWFIGTVAVLSLIACHGAVLDIAPKPVGTDSIISGTVRGPEGMSAIDSRVVEAVNLTTGERQRTVTNPAGGFAFKVKAGKYRVQLTLRDGESIVKEPGVVDVNKSDVDAHADFVVGSGRLSRPRHPVYRSESGLGSPIA